MFIIDAISNTATPIKRESFSGRSFQERQHLQEWIAKNPSILGESLLIIAKEFDGWEETRERLDLLALDSLGQIVVIENKLDDSGRDVTWQALKYAAYCSTLTRAAILDIYRDYLRKNNDDAGNAETNIAEFLSDSDDFDGIDLNEGNRQRVILVAARFRPEVTATCLWLRDHKIDIQCIRASLFSYEEQVFLNFERIIPPREAEEFMVRIAQKKTEETQDDTARITREARRKRYWETLLFNLTGNAAQVFGNRAPSKDHWLQGSTGITGVSHNFHMIRGRIRYEMTIASSETSFNKALFDKLHDRRGEIEAQFGDKLDWARLDTKKASRIRYGTDLDPNDESNWPAAIDWHIETMNRAIAALQPHIDDIKPTLS